MVQMNLNAVGRRRRRDRRDPRVSLRRYADSPFRHLHDSNNDQALLNATGVDHAEFRNLLAAFKPIFDAHRIDESTGYVLEKKKAMDGSKFRGRQRSVDAVGCLGLVLMWFRTTGAVKSSVTTHLWIDSNSHAQVA